MGHDGIQNQAVENIHQGGRGWTGGGGGGSSIYKETETKRHTQTHTEIETDMRGTKKEQIDREREIMMTQLEEKWRIVLCRCVHHAHLEMHCDATTG